MLVLLQAVAFAGCVLVDLLPSTEVQCRFGVPVATWSGTAPAGENAPPECPAPPPVPVQCTETSR